VTALVRLCKVASAGWSESKTELCKEAMMECLQHTVEACAALEDWGVFCNDPFISLFIAKFALCRVVLQRHVQVPRQPQYVPSSVPELPSTALPPLALLEELFREMGVEAQFDLKE
jgi:hypothetical protein